LTRNDDGDQAALGHWIRALHCRKDLEASGHRTLLSAIMDVAKTRGDRPALIDEQQEITYGQLVRRAHFFMRWGLDQGLPPGSSVCLLMPNCVDYLPIWLGLGQIGCSVALINTNLVDRALAHCITAADSTIVIVAGTLATRMADAAKHFAEPPAIWVHGDGLPDLPHIDIAGQDETALLETTETRLPERRDRALLLFTSGTTGLPKAANVTHARVLEWSYWFAGMMDTQPDDRLYDCLPMYHSVGGIVAIGAMLVKGGSVVIRPRFSASRFWDDVVDTGCTIFQYIGELCRYLTQSPPHPRETAHRLRLACGNGLQAQVWDTFRTRFAIPRILEFYAATEGNVSLYNCEAMKGSIGRIPGFLRQSFPVGLIRVDLETGEPQRGSDGLCQRCEVGESGEAVGKLLSDGAAIARNFDGYTDPAASERKIMRDVFKPGDRWFRTGDLMRRDEAGFFYFIDRLGDTFRRKGENVSTTEVAGLIAAFPGVTDAVVFGVAIPGQEGRAGMATIAADPGFDLCGLRRYLKDKLPAYAAPLFIRLCDNLDRTGTFKLIKGALPLMDLADFPKNSVWFDDPRCASFVKFDEGVLAALSAGEIRV
jgi:fatty-acyl-CoA synthase